ncbi:alpha-(1,3)-fucosyltransferase C-like [Achroia grisella]|uniref:alpha-(1,3)-fucosyltransferase C-like n=1 Tax=Achroia grisella TaxID=688607 RepID=UPI0027D27DF3|nr:alpha-(1,3)-fucosyltransferase C-like [Achroia grisella]
MHSSSVQSRRHKFLRKFYYTIAIIIAYVTFYYAHTHCKYQSPNNTIAVKVINNYSIYYLQNHTTQVAVNKPKLETKYILLWTNPHNSPFVYFGNGSAVFENKKCLWKNCYVTGDRNYLGDYSEFDVIVFNGPQLNQILNYYDIPKKRLLSQKYVYANVESAATYPICSDIWNDFFNWTWTYRLDSDSIWGYISVRNATGHVIGPNEIMNWINISDMDDIDEKLKSKLKSKKKLVAWFVSNCDSMSLREEYVKIFQQELRKYNSDVDIFGSCGKHQCPRDIMPRCLDVLERDYYFYFAFENAISQDYVTEKILYPLNHNTVPVVFGGANYTRFMPHGIYLNAREMEPKVLAKTMYDITRNFEVYCKFFRWKKYYSYHFRHEIPDTDDYCNFCAVINNDNLIKTTTVYKDFDRWWAGNDTCFSNNDDHLYEDKTI